MDLVTRNLQIEQHFENTSQENTKKNHMNVHSATKNSGTVQCTQDTRITIQENYFQKSVGLLSHNKDLNNNNLE